MLTRSILSLLDLVAAAPAAPRPAVRAWGVRNVGRPPEGATGAGATGTEDGGVPEEGAGEGAGATPTSFCFKTSSRLWRYEGSAILFQLHTKGFRPLLRCLVETTGTKMPVERPPTPPRKQPRVRSKSPARPVSAVADMGIVVKSSREPPVESSLELPLIHKPQTQLQQQPSPQQSQQSQQSLQDQPYRKKKIPAAVREQVWIRHMGRVFEGRCNVVWCSNHITVFDFQAGHNIPESKGGETTVENLIPICARCNLSMSDSYTIDGWNTAFTTPHKPTPPQTQHRNPLQRQPIHSLPSVPTTPPTTKGRWYKRFFCSFT